MPRMTHNSLFRYWISSLLATILASHLAAAQASAVEQSDEAKASAQSSQADVLKLEVRKRIERELRGGQSHSYEITLEAGHFLNAVVEQRGIDVVVQVIAPDGKQLMEVDSPNGDKGDEPVTLITEAAGVYRVNVNSLEKNAPVGKYEIRVEELRAPTEIDRALIEKNHLLQEATKLFVEAEGLKMKAQYDAALPLAERAWAIYEKVLGEHPITAALLGNLATLYREKGDNAKAEPLYLRALAISERALGTEHPDTATALNNLAALYHTKGDYTQAEPLYIRALGVYEKALGAEHPYTATSLSSLAELYRAKGEYAKAEPLFIRALGIYEKALGAEHPYTATSLLNLAKIYHAKSDYAKAEPLLIRALAIREKTLSVEHPDTAYALEYLATAVYLNKGDYAKAEPLLIRALAINEKALGAEHPVTVMSLSNLAVLYESKGDYAKAEPLNIRALAIREKALGAEHPSVAQSLTNLAGVYKSKGDYAKAEPLIIRALAINEKALGAEHPSVARSLDNLAFFYGSKGDYAKAEPLQIRALAIYEKALGAEDIDTAISANNLGELYRAKGDYAKAIDFQSRCNDVLDRDLIRNLASGSERQKLAYLNKTSAYTDYAISLHAQSAPNNRKAKRAALKVLLQRKGRTLDAMTDAVAALRRRVSPEDQKLLNELQDVRSQLSVLTLRGPGREGLEKHKANLKALEEQEEKLQNDMSQRSAEFRAQSQTQSKPVTIEIIQKAIPQGAALIEFAQYRPSDPNLTNKEKRYGKPRYVAYVLPSRGQSLWVELGDAESIKKNIDALRKALRDERRQDVKRLARAVDHDVMQPVRKLLGKRRRVFISPDSTLNLIPFAALVDERNQYLVKRYHFVYLTSGRDLLRLQVKTQSKQGVMVVADPDFGGDTTPCLDRKLKISGGAVDFSRVLFCPLTGTASEGEALQALMPGATVLMKQQATERSVKQAAGPKILHIATHGFFLEDVVINQAAAARGLLIDSGRSGAAMKVENPLLRSGLAMAGANLHKSGDDDGVLTALEAAALDLWGTELVVLSACDTGVGEVKNGEGVYGLRRALVLAGSESQVMSLWPVSDIATRDLMIEYCKRLLSGEGRAEALRQVQLKILASKKHQHPYYWASFIQSGEWANLDGKR